MIDGWIDLEPSELSVEDLEDADFDVAGERGPGLKHVELVTEEMLLLLHFQIEDAGFPSEHQEVADAVGAGDGAVRVVRVRRSSAGQWRCGAGGGAGRSGTHGAGGGEGGLEATERVGAVAEGSEGLETVLTGGRDHFEGIIVVVIDGDNCLFGKQMGWG